MTTRIIAGVAALWIFFVVSVCGQELELALPPTDAIEVVDGHVGITSLAEFERITLENHPALTEAMQAVEVARGRAIQAGLHPNPAVTGGTNQLGGQQTQFVATIDQEIVTKGKLRLDRRAVEREVEQAELTLKQVRFEVLSNLRRSFYRTLLTQQRVDVLDVLVGLLEKSYDASVKREKSGEAARTDTLLLDVELKRAKIRLRNSRTSLAATKKELATVTGASNLMVTDVSGDPRQALPDYANELLEQKLLEGNSKIVRAQVEIARRQTILQRAEVEPYPNVTLQGGYQYSVSDPNNQAILQIRVPIPVWNRNEGNILAARADVGRSVESLRKAEIELTRSLIAALGRFQASKELAEEFEKDILPAARETATLTQKAYEGGQFDFLRLLESQRSLVETNLEYLDAQLNRWLAAIEIVRLVQAKSFP